MPVLVTDPSPVPSVAATTVTTGVAPVTIAVGIISIAA